MHTLEDTSGFLLQSFLFFSWLAAIAGILFGACMLLRPEQVVRANQQFSDWMASARIAEQFGRTHKSERFFYRHHRLVGACLFLGATLVLYTFLFSYNLRVISTAFPKNSWWLLDGFVGLMLISSVPSAIVGFIMMTKPSLLRDLENSANIRIATNFVPKGFSKTNNSLEQLMLQHRKLAGGLLMAGSLYILSSLSHFLFRGTSLF
jgi:hypothetical protein